MALSGRANAPTIFWIVSALSLLWNAGGAFDYLMTQIESPAYMADFTPAQVAYFAKLPGWYVAFWAVGVWGALGGSALLLLRSRFAVPAFGAALVGLAVITVGTAATDLPRSLNTAGYWGFAVAVWLIEALLFQFARRCRRRNILR